MHPEVVRRLQASGHDVEWIAQTTPGSSDACILSRDDISNLILITYDRDFGDLIFHKNMPRPKAVVFSRLGRVELRYLSDRIATMLADSFSADHIHVLTKDGVHSAPFPAGVSND